MQQSKTHELMNSSVVWDNHACMPLRPEDHSFLPQLERFRKSGVHAVTLNVGFDAVPWEVNRQMLDSFRSWIAVRPREYLLVSSVEDIENARATGRLGVLFDIEGGAALDDRLELVQVYYELGVRWMLIAYNRNNSLGGGCQDEDCGLTAFGRSVLDEMARVGMVACCSHTGLRTTMDVMEYSSNPVIFSHSNPLGVWNHKRNVADEAIRACARTGGVVGVNGLGLFLGRNDSSTATVVNHVDYLVNLVGADHVGLGLDYVFDTQELEDFLKANPKTFPAEEGYTAGVQMVEPERIPELVDEMLRRGYPDDAIRRILGGNHLRVARQVWKPVQSRQ
jgi:membrane dipeptidase